MAQQGVPVSAAAAALGHDPAIFLRTYARPYPGDLRGVADVMDVAHESAREGAVTRQSGRISRGDESSCGISARELSRLSGTLVEAMGLEPTNLLTARRFGGQFRLSR
jgi:hypothetical protein